MELEETDKPFVVPADTRPHMPEPPPVSLVAVGDVEMPAVAGIERKLDGFYVGLLGFERDPDTQNIVYRADNFRLRFQIQECLPERDLLRPVGIAIEDYGQMLQKLNDREIAFTVEKGLTPGQETLLLRDPAGNWIELSNRSLASGF